MSNNEDRNLGVQPLDALLSGWLLENNDLVAASPEQLTHKQLVRARNGRRLTLKMMMKVSRAVNFAIWGRLEDEEREQFTEYFPKHLFNYSKGWDASLADPNLNLRGLTEGRVLRVDFCSELGL